MNADGKTVALVVAAGSGNRAGAAIPKQYRRLGSQAVLAHALDHLRHPAIDLVQVIIGEGQQEYYDTVVEGRALPSPVLGGSTRRESVRNGLERLAAQGGTARVLIHDAARPFLPASVIDRLLDAIAEYDGAAPVLPVADSLARSDGRLGEPVEREGLVHVQTPQAFAFGAILAAHRCWNITQEAGDDVQVARAAGYEIISVEGDKRLEKLTFADDFAQADARLLAAMTSRAGLGFDVHAFAAGDHLQLGGMRIAHDRALEGHSDADVVLHAITDALLGAAGEGDIGAHFPPGDPQWRGAASARFIEHARQLITARGGRIDHVDVTIICEAPRIAPYKEAMRAGVAAMLQLPVRRVSIKATTTERLGFAGRGEGIAAQAVATIRLPEDL